MSVLIRAKGQEQRFVLCGQAGSCTAVSQQREGRQSGWDRIKCLHS
jgi:hypothetical protein